ncbi:hypothetical protein PAPYR_1856 [Paratrimastix pyriformis]|uniref:protein-tyrosine-phosphatase n=1 Tax=Paratrimastix pyriformis TaxID=342808 RepID=A0ABQ8URF7_9EUKA|nr:hypothetical protein PAPYR_1856 [Paratrimastix pyriformis]
MGEKFDPLAPESLCQALVVTHEPIWNSNGLIGSDSSKVFDGLWVGAFPSEEYLRDSHFTHVLSLAPYSPHVMTSLKRNLPSILIQAYDVWDACEQPLRPFFDRCFAFLDDALGMEKPRPTSAYPLAPSPLLCAGRTLPSILPYPNTPVVPGSPSVDPPKVPSNHKVMIHCQAGISRSGALLIAYLMSRFRLTLLAALAVARAVRPLIRPNEGFIGQLAEFEEELFLAANPGQNFTPSISRIERIKLFYSY